MLNEFTQEMKSFFLSLIGLFSFTLLSGQVIISEFSAANYSLGVAGDNEDFVEFFNLGPTEVDLGGYFLSDNPDNPDMFEIPNGTTIASGGYLIIMCSNEGEVPELLYTGGYLNTNFKVTQTIGESIVFSDADGNILESYTFGVDWTPNQADHSWVRNVDGTSTWKLCTNPTPGGDVDVVNPGMYDDYAPTPQFQEESGFYAEGLDVTITAPAGYDIRYTTNGYAPDENDPLYTGPIAVDETTVVRARAFDASGTLADSHVNTNTYFAGDDSHSIVIVSASGDGIEDGAWPGGWGGGNPDEPCHLEFFHADGTYWCEASGDSNEHGNDSNAYPQKGFDYITRDQMGHSHAIPGQLFHVKDREEYQRLIFKAAANDNYPYSGGGHIRDAYVQTLSHLADLKVDERTNESCILYLNGEYWGVYEYREKVDDLDFTTEYYDQPRHFVDFMKTWGGTWVEYGSNDDWAPLVNFITSEDMTVDANYEYVQSVFNTMSMIDYVLLNSFVVCADWLNWNTAWWRGRHPDGSGKKWRYALWDMDNTFGHGANYTGIPSQGPDADPCNPESLNNPGGQGHIPMFNALLENEEFWATYINRWADLSNTHFSCDNMHAVLDSMIAVIDPEMPRQIERWEGNYAAWQENVQEIHDFIDERCAETLIGGIEDCYDVESVTLTIIIDGLGQIEVNSVDIGPYDMPLDATYFAGVPMALEAQEEYGELFLFWDVLDGDVSIVNPTNPNLNFTLNGDATIVAYFAANADPQEVVFDVNPPGAGDIVLDGALLNGYPSTQTLDYGAHSVEAIGLDEWHVFTGWTTTGTAVTPSAVAVEGGISITQAATVTANFEVIEHVDLNVRVEPAQRGSVRLEGGEVIVTNEWVGGLELDGILNAEAAPVEYWEFDHWEVTNSNPNPGPKAPSITLQVEDYEEIVAYFRPVDFAIYVPTGFSPNNDGLNDAFLPVGNAFKTESYHLVVMNRWGEVVFESFDPEEPWVGEHQSGGHFVRDGMYMFMLDVHSVHELAPRRINGSVSVVR